MPSLGRGSARETAESEVRVQLEIRPSLSVVLFPRGWNESSDVRTKSVVVTFDAGRPWVVSRI